jgi:hypothetical protein
MLHFHHVLCVLRLFATALAVVLLVATKLIHLDDVENTFLRILEVFTIFYFVVVVVVKFAGAG